MVHIAFHIFLFPSEICFLAYLFFKKGKFQKSGALLGGFFDGDGAGDGRADHRVVANADEPHHLDVRRDRGRTGKLRVAVHTAHGIGQAVGSRAGGHIVRVERAARAAVGCNREIFDAVLIRPFLIRTGNQVLETRRVCRVTRNGNVDFFVLHNGDALKHVVGAIDLDLGAFAVGIRRLADDLQLACGEIVVGFDIRKAVDAGNNIPL